MIVADEVRMGERAGHLEPVGFPDIIGMAPIQSPIKALQREVAEATLQEEIAKVRLTAAEWMGQLEAGHHLPRDAVVYAANSAFNAALAAQEQETPNE
jgi:hypothetical protein